MTAEAFLDRLVALSASSGRLVAREVLVWIDDRLASAGADAVTTLFTRPHQAGRDAGLQPDQTPQVAEIFDLMRLATARIEELSPQAVVSLLSCTLPLRAHPERAALVLAGERRLESLGEDRVENILRGLR
jgi:hypothetical protein